MKYLKKFEGKSLSNIDIRKDNFIKNSNDIHNGKYDYSNVEYISAITPVEIICPIHGIFLQNPQYHSRGSGCPKCGDILIKNKKRINKSAIFPIKSSEIHKNKYDYSDVEYVSAKKPVQISCPIHGSFFQTPDNHLSGKGCPKCGVDKNSNKSRKSLEEFVKSAHNIHKNKYDYSDVIYINDITKVRISCPKHGIFIQKPSHHLRGVGCPTCQESKGESIISNYLTSIDLKFERQKKFKECRYKYELPFDFWIESKNLLIEFDGIQHFNPIDYFGGQEKFEYLQLCDGIKSKFCSDNNINLLRITYRDIKEIEQILRNYLSQ